MMDFQISETSTHDDKDALKYTSNLFPINTWPLADLRGAPGQPPRVQILSFFMNFLQKICKIILIWELTHPSRENPGSATARSRH